MVLHRQGRRSNHLSRHRKVRSVFVLAVFAILTILCRQDNSPVYGSIGGQPEVILYHICGCVKAGEVRKS